MTSMPDLDLAARYRCWGCTCPVEYDHKRAHWFHSIHRMYSCASGGGVAQPNPHQRIKEN